MEIRSVDTDPDSMSPESGALLSITNRKAYYKLMGESERMTQRGFLGSELQEL